MTRVYGVSVSLISPWEDQCEWHRMTRMTRPDCAVMCNLINTHTHTHTHTHKEINIYGRNVGNGETSGGRRKKRRQQQQSFG